LGVGVVATGEWCCAAFAVMHGVVAAVVVRDGGSVAVGGRLGAVVGWCVRSGDCVYACMSAWAADAAMVDGLVWQCGSPRSCVDVEGLARGGALVCACGGVRRASVAVPPPVGV